MSTISRAVVTAGLTLIWACGNGAHAQLAKLIERLPETANAVVVVDAQAIFNSQIAKNENWQESRAERYASGMTAIPPKATGLAIATHLDIDLMRSEWEVAVVEMDAPRLITSLANQLGGAIDEVDGLPAVRLPDDSYLVEFTDGSLGAMSPGNRQKVAYWVNRPNRGLSPYLREAVAEAGSKAAIVMALDLDHAFSAQEVEQGIANFKCIEKAHLNKPAVAKLIAGAKGITLEVALRDKPYGLVAFDFSESPALIADIAKPFILEMLGDHGMMMDELNSWTPTVKGNRVALTGSFSKDGLTQVSSLVHLPSRALYGSADAPAAPGSGTATATSATKPNTLELTQQYLASVNSILKIVSEKKHDMQTLGQFAHWLEIYGRKLDHLPTLNVDPEMLQYGDYVSKQLLHVSYALKGIGIQEPIAADQAASSAKIYGGALGNISQNNWQSGYGSVGGNYGRRVETNAAYGVARNLGYEGAVKSEMRQAESAVTMVHFQSRAQAAQYIQQAIENLDTADDQIRESMTQKYQVQF